MSTVKFECEMMWLPCKYTVTADHTLLYDTNIQCEMMWLSRKITETLAHMEIPSFNIIIPSIWCDFIVILQYCTINLT